MGDRPQTASATGGDPEPDVDEVTAQVCRDGAVEQPLEPVGPEVALVGGVRALGQLAVEVLAHDLPARRGCDQLGVAVVCETCSSSRRVESIWSMAAPLTTPPRSWRRETSM